MEGFFFHIHMSWEFFFIKREHIGQISEKIQLFCH
jgi:hypothetical protein